VPTPDDLREIRIPAMVSAVRYRDVEYPMSPRPKEMPCPVCGVLVPVKSTHRGKPYWQCDGCGVQVFVRRQEGMKRLEDKGGEDELFG
jgi:hypothetical protein